jgi:hypothetical protein
MENKERISGELPTTGAERAVLTDLKKEASLPPEVRHWMSDLEKVETSAHTTIHDNHGQPILTPTGSAVPKLKIKATKNAFSGGFKKRVDDVGLWLSTFIFRLMKKNKDKLIEFEED